MGCGASGANYRHVQHEDPEPAGFGPGERIGGLKRGSMILRRSMSADFSSYYQMDSGLTVPSEGVSFVRCTSHGTEEQRSARCIRKHSRTQEDVDKEIDILRQMDHVNIGKLYEVFEDTSSWYLVTELCSLGRLSDAIAVQTFSETQAADIMTQVLRSIIYMHTAKVCHRDLRPEVIMLQDAGTGRDGCSVRLVDLGSACHIKKKEPMRGKVGSLAYSSPQMLLGQTYSLACDSWSCGAVMHALMCGTAPFGGGLTKSEAVEVDLEADMEAEVLENAKRKNWPRQWQKLSKHGVKLMKCLLAYDEDERWLPQRCLGESWFYKNGVESNGNVGLSVRHLENMKEFSTMNPLQKVTLNIIAQRLPESDTRMLRQTFDAMDFDQNGVVSYKELKMAVQDFKEENSWRTQVATAVDPKELMNLLDTNGSMELDFTEFIAATLSKKYYHDDAMLKAAFRALDADGSGEISLAELQGALLEDEGMSDEEAARIRKILQDADTDGNGEIDFDEFVRMMKSASAEKVHHRPSSMVAVTSGSHPVWTRVTSPTSTATSRASSKESRPRSAASTRSSSHSQGSR
eukprot:TRINITY_DN9830_c0_g2_i1.p1 TRINITY_DN9830_c0_g2~~TRINITY_DN9830_c0_g2_i1.p1  ORF type:complete len:574 (-),score=116.41 TRINITY_DN9830_c0_g2_i1:59-1780(-)